MTLKCIILFITALLLFISGCGGGTNSSTSPQIPSVTTDTGSLEMQINWPEKEEGLSAQLIPSDTVKIEITITGPNISPPIIVYLSKGEKSKIIQDIPAGEVQIEFKALDANGKILAHRITHVKVIAGQSVSVNVILGITLFSTGFVPSSITLNIGDILYFVNNDTVPHTICLTGLSNSGPIPPGGEYCFNCSSNSGKYYTFTCDGFSCNITVTGGAEPTPDSPAPGPTNTPTPTPTPTNTPTPTPTNTPTPTPTGYIIPEMVTIPSGNFPVCIGQGAADPNYPGTSVTGFLMGKYEVTNHEYKYFQDSVGGHWGGSGSIPDDNYPVVYVSFNDAAAYCNWLSDRVSLNHCYTIDGSGNVTNVDTSQNGYRLPDDIEWEYACRAGTGTDYFWGENYTVDNMSPGNIDSYCWYYYNSGTTAPGVSPPIGNQSHLVTSLSPNTWGLYHMSGNVWEWDNMLLIGSSRVIRGCSWGSPGNGCQSGYRNCATPDFRTDFGGFRVVRTP